MEIKWEVKFETEEDNSFRVVEYNGVQHYVIAICSGDETISRVIIPATTAPDEMQIILRQITDQHQDMMLAHIRSVRQNMNQKLRSSGFKIPEELIIGNASRPIESGTFLKFNQTDNTLELLPRNTTTYSGENKIVK